MPFWQLDLLIYALLSMEIFIKWIKNIFGNSRNICLKVIMVLKGKYQTNQMAANTTVPFDEMSIMGLRNLHKAVSTDVWIYITMFAYKLYVLWLTIFQIFQVHLKVIFCDVKNNESFSYNLHTVSNNFKLLIKMQRKDRFCRSSQSKKSQSM